MNDTTSHEQLSALMDGELPRDELRFLLRRLDRDDGLAARWSRHQVAAAALRREWFSPQSADAFASAVMARIDGEAIVAVRSGIGARVLRWAGGGAIAASVAVVALLATHPAGNVPGPTTAGSDAATTMAAVPTAAVAPAGVLRQAQPAPQLPAAFADYAQPASFESYESILPNYAPRHSAAQFGKPGAEGFIPYVLVVGARPAAAPANAAASGKAADDRR